MANGFIKFHRCLFETPFWQSEHRFCETEAMLDLLRRANFKHSVLHTKQEDLNIEPGQVVCTPASLARAWGWDPRTVKSFIRQLEVLGILSVTSNKPPCILTLHPDNRPH
jgi:hypothetical protein